MFNTGDTVSYGTSGVCTGLPGTGATAAICLPVSPVLASVLTTVTV